MDDSVQQGETKTIPKNLNEKKKPTCKAQHFYISFAILLIFIALLIVLIIYCYLTKYRPKQKHLVPFQITNSELKQVLY